MRQAERSHCLLVASRITDVASCTAEIGTTADGIKDLWLDWPRSVACAIDNIAHILPSARQ